MGIKVGSLGPPQNGVIKYDNNDLFGYAAGQWRSLTSGGGLSGTGSSGFIPKFSSSSSLSNSIIRESGNSVRIQGNGELTLVNGTQVADIFVNAAGQLVLDPATSGNTNSTLTIDDDNGNVGIGVAPATSRKLKVSGDVEFDGDLYLGSVEYIQDDPINGLTLITNASLVPSTDNQRSLGRSGRRWSSVWGSSAFINTSDSRLKKDFEDMHYGLDEILQLKPLEYSWRNPRMNQKRELGFLAQDLLKIVPEVVVTHEIIIDKAGKENLQPVEHYGVMYDLLIPVLTKAIQEQQAIIDSQAATITDLQTRIQNLESKFQEFSDKLASKRN